MQEHDNAMRRQVLSLPQLIRDQYADLEPKTRNVLTTPEIFSIQKILLTGCGDSHAAAIAAKQAFERLAGIPTEVVPTIELSRNYEACQLGFAPNNPLVIAVSNSGTVARVGEAVQRVVRHGAFALGITGNSRSLLGTSASRVLPLNIPPFEAAPGVRSYLVSILSLLLLAIRLGEVRGRYSMDEATACRSDLLRQSALLEQMLPEMDKEMLQLADQWKDLEAFDFIGNGCDFATAFYGQAKTFEAVGKYAMSINAEEWLHLNFFMRRVHQIGTIVVYNVRNAANSRTRELIEYASNALKRSLLIVTDVAKPDFAKFGRVFVPKSDYMYSGMLTQFVPVALLMGYIGEMIGEVDGRGCCDNWSFADDGAAIKNSVIDVL